VTDIWITRICEPKETVGRVRAVLI